MPRKYELKHKKYPQKGHPKPLPDAKGVEALREARRKRIPIAEIARTFNVAKRVVREVAPGIPGARPGVDNLALNWVGCDPEPCGYGCSAPWFRHPGTKLKGHEACFATPEFCDDLIRVWEWFEMLNRELPWVRIPTQAQVADSLGFSIHLIRRWVARGRENRRLGIF